MIVDVHSHFFTYPGHFTPDFVNQSRRARNGVEVDLTVRWQEYEATAADCRWTIVFGGKAKLAGVWVPDEEVASYVAQHPDRADRLSERGPDATRLAGRTDSPGIRI